MEQILQNIISGLSSKDNVVIGISGGVDSMVLFDLLCQAKKQLDFNLLAVHIEHGIRGQQSLQDAKFVKEYCEKQNVQCKVFNVDALKLAKQQKQTVEQAARNYRYKVFSKELGKNGKLFLAHHKNDQAETVLMHIFRGSGIDGAKGITNRDNIFRPLLSVTKEEILQYANQNNIPFVQDSTNLENDYARNFIRNEILPKIEQFYPKVVDNLAKFADFCNQYDQFIEDSIDPSWLISQPEIKIDLAGLQSSVICAKLVKKAYNLCGEFADLESKHIAMVQNMANFEKNGCTYNLPHGVVAEKRDNYVYFYKTGNKPTEKYNFAVGNHIVFDTEIDVQLTDNIDGFLPNTFYMDFDKIPSDAVWRTRQNGDVFAKLGSGNKKLNDYFTDKKLSKNLRDTVLLLASGSNILCIKGYDVSDKVKLDGNTQTIAIIKFDTKK